MKMKQMLATQEGLKKDRIFRITSENLTKRNIFSINSIGNYSGNKPTHQSFKEIGSKMEMEEYEDNSKPNPTKGKATSIKEASAKPRDENKDPMPRSGPSPKNFGMNSRIANFLRMRSVFNSSGFKRCLAKHSLQRTAHNTKYHQPRKGDGRK